LILLVARQKVHLACKLLYLSHKDSFSLGEDLSQPGTRNCKQWLEVTAEPAGWSYIPNFKFLRGAGMEENEKERRRKGLGERR